MSLRSLIATGTKVWLDSIDPQHVRRFAHRGITGATSNPIIIADIIKAGTMDEEIRRLMDRNLDDSAIAWELTDRLVRQAQEVFRPAWQATGGDDGYVSFELDPLLEDVHTPLPVAQRTERYIELASRWADLHSNRMIKVPATQPGIAAMEQIAANGVTINVTLCFTQRQYTQARDVIWRGAQRRTDGLRQFKSVYSIFVSRVDVYTRKHIPQLSPQAQGQVGILNAKQLWRMNQDFWANKNLPLRQEIIFASTGVKDPGDPPDKYVEALAGSDIQTNPPQTNDAVEKLNKTYRRRVDELPPDAVVSEIERLVDQDRMEQVLMEEGLAKFAEPQHQLLKLIAEKREALTT